MKELKQQDVVWYGEVGVSVSRRDEGFRVLGCGREWGLRINFCDIVAQS